jgi:hypothetical protein
MLGICLELWIDNRKRIFKKVGTQMLKVLVIYLKSEN